MPIEVPVGQHDTCSFGAEFDEGDLNFTRLGRIGLDRPR